MLYFFIPSDQQKITGRHLWINISVFSLFTFQTLEAFSGISLPPSVFRLHVQLPSAQTCSSVARKVPLLSGSHSESKHSQSKQLAAPGRNLKLGK